MDGISLTDWTVSTIIGLLDREQRAPQPVTVTLHLGLDPEPASSGDLSASIDYAGVQSQVETVLQQGRWRLLETAVVGIAAWLLAPPGPGEERGSIDRVDVTLAKPTILIGATPSVRLVRDGAWATSRPSVSLAAGVTATTLVTADGEAVTRLCLQAGATVALPAGVALEVAGGALDLVGTGGRVARGAACTRRAGPSGATVLAVGTPLV
jgi:FolB domain-containing protein